MKLPRLNLEDIFIGAALQFPLYFIIHWWVLCIMPVAGILWALGGIEGGSKTFRRIALPVLICGSTFACLHECMIFVAIPFMIWVCPFSYGEDSWLFIFFKRVTNDQRKADFLTRGILYVWYWLVFGIALLLRPI